MSLQQWAHSALVEVVMSTTLRQDPVKDQAQVDTT